MRSASAVVMFQAVAALMLLAPSLGRRQQLVVEEAAQRGGEALDAEAEKAGATGGYLCCCMEKACVMKGNSEDALKFVVVTKGSIYCCKVRSWWFSEVCDTDKYTLPVAGLTGVHDAETCIKEEGADEPIATTTEAEEAKTTTTTTTEAEVEESTTVATEAEDPKPTTTTTTTLDAKRLIDVTPKFAPDFDTVKLSDGVSYRCCCEKNNAENDVQCELTDDSATKVIRYKSGCGGLKGQGFHGWYKLKERSGYENFANANKCVVPAFKLPEVF